MSCIEVEVMAHADSQGQFQWELPIYYDGLDIGGGVEILEQTSSFIKVKSKPNELLAIKYHCCDNSKIRSVFYPILESGLFYFSREHLLALPGFDQDKQWMMNFKFIDFPESFKISTSSMNGLKTYQVNDTIDHFKDSYFALGNLKQKNFQVEGQPVSFFTTFKKPIKVFAPEGPESYFKKILKEHRNFWREKEYPQYNILLIEQIKDEEAFQGCHMQQFASFMMPNVEEKHKKRVFQSFSHELFHEWLGYRMHFEQVQAPAQWFWEGFTDYYGLHLVHKSGLLSLREKIEHYNTHILIPYYTHPLNRLTSAEFEKRFKRRGGVAILAQYQGHMIATNLAALHLHSKGPNVDDLMRKIYAEFNGKTIDNQQLQKAFSDFYGNKIWGLLNEARINGELFILPENIFGKNICLVNKKIKVPSLGFDSEQLMLQNKIIKIDLKSNAYKAGLREAQEVESYTIEFHNIHKPCSVTIKEGGKSRNIIFYPEIVQKIIPQYKMKKKWLFI